MKNLVCVVVISLVLLACSSNENKNKTIYLVRHAEKDTLMAKDPSLTVDGVMRAVDLATWFKRIKVDTILSSDFKRTIETAEPLAEAQGIAIGKYNPKEFNKIAESLKNMAADTIVMIGHSNTILEQIQAFGIEKPQETLGELEYDKIFEVKLSDKKAVVHQYGPKYVE